MTESVQTIDFHYIKGNDYRELSCDGVVGGLTPQQKVWLSFYAERFPLPRQTRHALKPTEVEGEYELDQSVPVEIVDSRNAIVRHVEVGVYLDRQAALQLRDWLSDRLKEMGET